MRGQKILTDILPETGTFVNAVPRVPGDPDALARVMVATPNCASPNPRHVTDKLRSSQTAF